MAASAAEPGGNRQGRLYHAYLTKAPTVFDAPPTMTRHESTATDLAGFAIDPEGLDSFRSKASARLVLIDVIELAWQRPATRGPDTSSRRQTTRSSA